MRQATWRVGWHSKIVLTVITVSLVALLVRQLPGKVEAKPEEGEKNHHAGEVYKIAHSTPFRSGMIRDVAELGFNVIHTNQTRKMEPDDVWNFLEKCKLNGVLGLPRVDRGSHLEKVLERIREHPNLLGVISDDESEGERISLAEQINYYSAVKTTAPKVLVFRNWNGTSPKHSWEEFFPPKDKIRQVCDVVLLTVYPWGKVHEEYIPEKWLKSERDRVLPYLNPDTPLVPIMQGFYGEGFKKPNLQMQWNFWKKITNSYAIWLYRADTGYKGFGQDDELREQVKKLNKEVRHKAT